MTRYAQRQFDGTKRRVGWLRRHTSSKVGRPGTGWLRDVSAGLGGNGPAKSGTEETTPPISPDKKAFFDVCFDIFIFGV